MPQYLVENLSFGAFAIPANSLVSIASANGVLISPYSIRRICHNGIHLAERRQYLPAIPEIECDALSELFDAAHPITMSSRI